MNKKGGFLLIGSIVVVAILIGTFIYLDYRDTPIYQEERDNFSKNATQEECISKGDLWNETDQTCINLYPQIKGRRNE